jgi:uncharacterized protein YndB with AHSA1/START domain
MSTDQQDKQQNKLIVNAEGEREILSERIFDAPRERVFAAYTDPELAPRWWGRRGDTTVVEQMDPVTGGDWRFRCESPEGTIVFRGTYREVTAPERIVQTFEWDGMPGYVSVDHTEFEDLGDGRTRLVVKSVFFAGEERDGMIEAGMEKGFGETLDRLEELLAGQSA